MKGWVFHLNGLDEGHLSDVTSLWWTLLSVPLCLASPSLFH